MFYRSPLAGLCRSAPSPAVLAMAQSKGNGNVLTDKDMTEEEKHALGKTGAGLLDAHATHLPRSVQTACRDDAFRRAVQTELGLKKLPASSLLATAIKRYRAQPTPEPSKKTRAPPKRRGPPSPIAQRAATSAPLAEQNKNTGESAVVAEAPPTKMADAAQHALRALNGETHTTKKGKQKVEVKTAGGDWVEYKSQTDALKKVPGLKDHVLRALLGGNASVASSTSPTPTPSSDSPHAVSAKRFPCPAGCDRFFTHAPAAASHGKTCAAKQKVKFEARLVSNKRPIGKLYAFMLAADEIGLRHDIGHAADLMAAVSELVPRVVLPHSDKEAPKTWKALLEYVTSLSPLDQRVLFTETRRAEDKRVLKLLEANGIVGREVQGQLRRDEAEKNQLLDEECQQWVERLMVLAQRPSGYATPSTRRSYKVAQSMRRS